MKLSKRLQAIADLVPPKSHVIDVGTDHAYIPIYLVQNGIAIDCLATDIRKGPLEKARKNLEAYHIQNVALIQTNGLEGISCGTDSIVIISGMGGYLITDILQKGKRFQKLILQPQQDSRVVRKFLHEHGYEIIDETFIKDEEKYYTIIVAELGNVTYYKHDYEYTYGKHVIEKKLPVFKEWLEIKLEKQETIYRKLPNSAVARKEELLQEINTLRKVKECLNSKNS